jgi:hypothetical protein
MGLLLSCHCDNCDFSAKDLELGSGMTEGHFMFPAYNSRNKSIVNLDIYDYLETARLQSIEYKNGIEPTFETKRKFPYFLPKMFKINKTDISIISESPYLQSTLNFCPKCKNCTLNFTEIGLLD